MITTSGGDQRLLHGLVPRGGTFNKETAFYLNRIGYRGPRRPTLTVLCRLQLRHLLSVPFENLDIHMRRPIILDLEHCYRKIVEERRGGYCYELNGCFAWLLRRLGFRVSMLSARVARRTGGFTPEFDHMTLLVHLRGRWLVDVGFGDLTSKPLRLDDANPQSDGRRIFRTAKNGTTRVLMRLDGLSTWKSQYAFSLRPRRLGDFAARNRYQQSSRRSHFTQGRLISKLTTSGRITLTDRSLIVTRDGRRMERPVRTRNEFNKLLTKHFGQSFGFVRTD
jgi:N-hydroxyarylamine O-acetyltransferase